MRVQLARVLMSRADLIFLDEPTNHLDEESVIWLEDWLISYQTHLLLEFCRRLSLLEIRYQPRLYIT